MPHEVPSVSSENSRKLIVFDWKLTGIQSQVISTDVIESLMIR